MNIYGVALLSGCYLLGKIMGIGLGKLIDIDGDIGGVGFGIVLLVLSTNHLKKRGGFRIKPKTESFSGLRSTFQSLSPWQLRKM